MKRPGSSGNARMKDRKASTRQPLPLPRRVERAIEGEPKHKNPWREDLEQGGDWKARRMDAEEPTTIGGNMPTNEFPGVGAVGGTGPTELGTEGVPYGSEAAERLVAARLAELRASDRPADRMGVMRELVSGGQIASFANRPHNHDHLAPSEEGPARSGNALGGRSLGDHMAIQTQGRASEARANPAPPSSSGRYVRLTEEGPDAVYQRRYTSMVFQGYPEAQARAAAEFAATEARRLAEQRL